MLDAMVDHLFLQFQVIGDLQIHLKTLSRAQIHLHVWVEIYPSQLEFAKLVIEAFYVVNALRTGNHLLCLLVQCAQIQQ